jgi:predicted RNA-binding Zn-ribbon protein involved in translation (DUF1610 family)
MEVPLLEFFEEIAAWIQPLPESEMRIPCRPNAEVVREGMHKHRCHNCGTTWKHSNLLPLLATPKENKIAHSCPKCGTEEWFKYGLFC